MRNFVGSLALGGAVFLILLLLSGPSHHLTSEDAAFHMALGAWAGLRFGSDFNMKQFWPHLGITASVYFPMWALLALTTDTVITSGAERAVSMGALSTVTMWLSLVLYEAYKKSQQSLIDRAFAEPVPPAVESDAWTPSEHWIDAHEQKLIAQNGSTAGMIEAAEWACRAWEHEVVRLYKLLLPAVNDDLRAVLIRSQKEWVKLRESDMLFGDLVYGQQQGSMYAPMQVSARAEISKDRAIRLQHRLELLNIHIPSIGPRSVPSTSPTEKDFIQDNDIPGNGGNPS